MGKLLLSHRSTSCLCYVPVLEEYEGASRKRLTQCKSTIFFESKKRNLKNKISW